MVCTKILRNLAYDRAWVSSLKLVQVWVICTIPDIIWMASDILVNDIIFVLKDQTEVLNFTFLSVVLLKLLSNHISVLTWFHIILWKLQLPSLLVLPIQIGLINCNFDWYELPISGINIHVVWHKEQKT